MYYAQHLENVIKLLKNTYTPTVKFYRWFTIELYKRYYAAGPKITQRVIESILAEGISIEEYVTNRHFYSAMTFLAETNVYKVNWIIHRNHIKENSLMNAKLLKRIRSKKERRWYRRLSR